MDRKERALELARQQYADGGGPRYTPSYTEHGALIGPSMRDRANMVRDAFDSAAGHPFVRVAREYPREMAQEVCSSVCRLWSVQLCGWWHKSRARCC